MTAQAASAGMMTITGATKKSHLSACDGVMTSLRSA